MTEEELEARAEFLASTNDPRAEQAVKDLHRAQQDRLTSLRGLRNDPSRLVFFFLVFVGIVLLLVFVFGSQKPTAAAIPSNPAIATAFR